MGAGKGGVVAHPKPKPRTVVARRLYGGFNLTMIMYRMERESVDPVFFAVVPDSFMTRESCSRLPARQSWDGTDYTDEQDRPLVAPNDRWSF